MIAVADRPQSSISGPRKCTGSTLGAVKGWWNTLPAAVRFSASRSNRAWRLAAVDGLECLVRLVRLACGDGCFLETVYRSRQEICSKCDKGSAVRSMAYHAGPYRWGFPQSSSSADLGKVPMRLHRSWWVILASGSLPSGHSVGLREPINRCPLALGGHCKIPPAAVQIRAPVHQTATFRWLSVSVWST